ncbi:MAG TPA: Na+/H+ antiporter NhaC family protein [Reyranella sp.]|nr:Na+/H+ antiporter NhaC family protein [Reyranella sp.]
MADRKTRPPLSLIEAIVPVASLILLVGLSYYLFKDGGMNGPNQVGMVMATMITVFLGWRRGHTLHELSDAAVASVSSGIGAIFILFAVGALIGTWAMSGTLVTMVFYGLKILNPAYFYVSAAAITAAISVGIGSSWTTAGTVGIGLMGISGAMGLDPAITAGAIVSGAYFGDTVSPLSDSANLAAGVTDVELYVHIRRTGQIAAVALAIALVFFWFAGGTASVDASYKMATLDGDFHVSLVLFLPLLFVVALALLKVRPFTTIFLGAIAGGLMAVIVAPDRVEAFAEADKHVPVWLAQVKGVWEALARGYVSTTGHPMVDQLTTRGGMASMLSTIWLVMAAFAFGGVADRIGVLDRLITPITRAAKSTVSLVVALVVSVLATSIATADQYLAVVLPGRMFRRAFEDRGHPPVLLSSSLGASATPTSALIPWNSCGAYLAATLGVATLSYAPYAIFNFANPLLAIGAAWIGAEVLRRRGSKHSEGAGKETAMR